MKTLKWKSARNNDEQKSHPSRGGQRSLWSENSIGHSQSINGINGSCRRGLLCETGYESGSETEPAVLRKNALWTFDYKQFFYDDIFIFFFQGNYVYFPLKFSDFLAWFVKRVISGSDTKSAVLRKNAVILRMLPIFYDGIFIFEGNYVCFPLKFADVLDWFSEEKYVGFRYQQICRSKEKRYVILRMLLIFSRRHVYF